MLTRFFFVSGCSSLHPLRSQTQRLGVSCVSLLMVSIVIFSQASLGQDPLPIAPSNQVGSNASPSLPKAKSNSGPASVEPLTPQASESSTEIAPADRRIISDIKELRAMLGGGLAREFEEINQALRQHPASMVSPASHEQDDKEAAQEDRGGTQDDWFSRELGQMVQARSQLLPTSDQSESSPQQRAKSHQPFPPQPDRRDTPLGDDPRSALRQCARELELVAGALEQIEAYENADSVRREAAQLWEKARNK